MRRFGACSAKVIGRDFDALFDGGAGAGKSGAGAAALQRAYLIMYRNYVSKKRLHLFWNIHFREGMARAMLIAV